MANPIKNNVLESNRLAGTRLELLLFRLEGPQQYGINVFKVQEVIPYQKLTAVPGSHHYVNGIATLRGTTMPIIDLSRAIGRQPLSNPREGNIIITEYNRSVHGFLVASVANIVNTQWETVQPQPKGIGRNTFVTAVTIINGQMVEILDVEKVLDQVVHTDTHVSDDLTQGGEANTRRVLVVDDSSVARKQITQALGQIGIDCMTAHDGREALDMLKELVASGADLESELLMVISDIEMPEMDGYMLTTAIRQEMKLQKLYILLHSSISGVFNVDMVRKTGANKFIQKYSADDLASAVLEVCREANLTPV